MAINHPRVPTPISVYLLTHNSEKHLADILRPLQQCTDEICIIDSGSTDGTLAIAAQYHAKVLTRAFTNFREQRNFALEHCEHDWVLRLDSDEIPDTDFINVINKLRHSPAPDAKIAFQFSRHWNVLGKDVHAIYPVSRVPDFPVRLFNRQQVHYPKGSRKVHENPQGFTQLKLLPGSIKHITFTTEQEFTRKITLYTNLAAEDLLQQRKHLSNPAAYIHAISAFLKCYFIRRGILDGYAGRRIAQYAYQYTFEKYRKAIKLRTQQASGKSPNA